jgi:hypothetical protein
MTIYEPNPVVRPTGEEAGEFLDEALLARDDTDDGANPGRKRTGTLPARRDEPPPLG